MGEATSPQSCAKIEGHELEWITTQSPGDARKAAKEYRDGLLIVVGGDGTISEVERTPGRRDSQA